MTKIWAVLAVAACMLAAEQSHGDMIKYTDKDGTMCFVDELSKVPKQYRKNIIREEEAAPEDSPVRQQAAASAGSSDSGRVQVCYGSSGIYRMNGRDITDFLAGRDYPYQTRDVTGNPGHTRACAEMWCRLYEKNGSSGCIEEKSKNIQRYMSFTAIGDKLYPSTESRIYKNIDMHFNIDPNSPIKWKE